MQSTVDTPVQDEQVIKRRRRRRRRRRPLGPFILLGGFVFMLVMLLFGILGESGEAEQDPEQTAAVPGWIAQEFLTVNPYSRPGTALTEVNGLVVHNTGNPGTTARQNRDYFESLGASGETSSSSHFVVGIDGEIIQCVPLDEIAYCSNSRNSDTVSIEVCHPDETGEFTGESYDSLIRLLRWLCDTYNLDESAIIRHGDIIEKDCPLYYMENEEAWEALLADVAKA